MNHEPKVVYATFYTKFRRFPAFKIHKIDPPLYYRYLSGPYLRGTNYVSTVPSIPVLISC